jgi:hypothetical protein
MAKGSICHCAWADVHIGRSCSLQTGGPIAAWLPSKNGWLSPLILEGLAAYMLETD